jgi:hypothetical protein
VSSGALLSEHGAANTPDGEKNIPAARPVKSTGRIQKHSGKGPGK